MVISPINVILGGGGGGGCISTRSFVQQRGLFVGCVCGLLCFFFSREINLRSSACGGEKKKKKKGEGG